MYWWWMFGTYAYGLRVRNLCASVCPRVRDPTVTCCYSGTYVFGSIGSARNFCAVSMLPARHFCVARVVFALQVLCLRLFALV